MCDIGGDYGYGGDGCDDGYDYGVHMRILRDIEKILMRSRVHVKVVMTMLDVLVDYDFSDHRGGCYKGDDGDGDANDSCQLRLQMFICEFFLARQLWQSDINDPGNTHHWAER